MGKVVTFGEIMLRLTPDDFPTMRAYYGGAEANVAVLLSCLGERASFVTKLPIGALGDFALETLKRYGVETDSVVRGKGKMGVYFCENDGITSNIVYDRADSAVALADENEFDWDGIFAGAARFHFTGITPALSDGLKAACITACKAARRLGVVVSCDLNYREKLWDKSDARAAAELYMPYVDDFIINEHQARDVLGIAPEPGAACNERYVSIADILMRRYGFKNVGITVRGATDGKIVRSGLLYTGGNAYFSRIREFRAADGQGGGDAFCGGLIYAMKNGYSKPDAIEFAVAASCMKNSARGDFATFTVEMIKDYANN